MERYNKANGVGVAPAAPAAADYPYYTAGDPENDIPATTPGPWWFHMMTEELRALVVAGGILPAHNVLTNVRDAVQALIAAGAASNQGVTGNSSNLKVSATGTNAQITLTADAICLKNAAGKFFTVLGVSIVINTAAVGANGLDSGVLAANTLYYTHVIYNPTTNTVGGIVSLSASAPTLPVGYTYSARQNAFFTDATGNKYPLRFGQTGRKFRYRPAAGTNLTKLPTLVSGVQGSTPATFTSVAIGAFVPPTAGIMTFLAADTAAASGSVLIVAPSDAYRYPYGATPSGNPAPWCSNMSGGGANVTVQGDIALESTNVYVIFGSSSCVLNCLGWEDNL